MSINSHDQPKKTQKFGVISQSEDNTNQIKQETEAKKTKDKKAKKEKKRRRH